MIKNVLHSTEFDLQSGFFIDFIKLDMHQAYKGSFYTNYCSNFEDDYLFNYLDDYLRYTEGMSYLSILIQVFWFAYILYSTPFSITNMALSITNLSRNEYSRRLLADLRSSEVKLPNGNTVRFYYCSLLTVNAFAEFAAAGESNVATFLIGGTEFTGVYRSKSFTAYSNEYSKFNVNLNKWNEFNQRYDVHTDGYRVVMSNSPEQILIRNTLVEATYVEGRPIRVLRNIRNIT